MKLALFLTALIPSTLAANSFSGANVRFVQPFRARTLTYLCPVFHQNYFIYALPTADRIAILDGMQAVGMKVCA
jgi:hypothetical protein